MIKPKIRFYTLQLLIIYSHIVVAQDFNLKNYLTENEKDATLAVYTMLQDASKHKNSQVIIEKGTYHFYPEKAYEQYCYITNHDNSMRRIAFNIQGVDGMTIDASGATFIFHGVMMPFNIENSKNIDISKMTIDWHTPLHSEALVVANDTASGTFDLKIADNMPYTIRNDQLYFIKEGFEHDLQHAILFDPKRKAIAYRNYDFMPLKMTRHAEIRFKNHFDFPNYVDFRIPDYETQNKEYVIKATELEPGIVRISGNNKTPPPVGMVLVCKGQFGKDRIANAFHINESSNIKLHNLNIHYAGGMGIIGERSENITLNHVNIVANPEKDLMVSTSADASHFAGCKGKISIDNCNFRHQLDDAVNIHGAYVLVEDILAPNRVGVRLGHFQQAGFVFAQAGDAVGFIVNEKVAEVTFKTTVQAFNRLNQHYYIITFEEDVAGKIEKGYILENLDWYPEVTITNSQFADNRARALLLKSPKKTIVKNNYFSNQMQALLISGGINTWWYESGGAQDIIIEGNTFGDCNYDGGKRPVIILGGRNNNKGRVLGKIIITNNTFNNFNPSILKATGVKQLEFTNNSINNSNTFLPTFKKEYVVEVKGIHVLKIKDVSISEDFQNKYKVEEIKNDISPIE